MTALLQKAIIIKRFMTVITCMNIYLMCQSVMKITGTDITLENEGAIQNE